MNTKTDEGSVPVAGQVQRPVGRPVSERDNHDGQCGTSDAPDNCTECGAEWAHGERLHTGDSEGIGGWEDWMHCAACGCQMFFPVTHRHEPPNGKVQRKATAKPLTFRLQRFVGRL